MLYPKIGIRPTIDGRWGGIRESLEAQTMGLAQAAQTLISSLRYPDGTPVQAVISPCTIGGGAFLLIGVVLVILALRQGMLALRAQAAEIDRIEAEERAALEEKTEEDEDDAQA